jgi:hypothetical protein
VTTVRELGLPPGWAPTRWFGTAGMAALMLALGVFMIAMGLPWLGEGTPYRAAAVLLGVGFTGFAVMIVRHAMRVRQTATRDVDLAKDDDGTLVLRVRRPRALQLASCAWLLSAGGGALLLGATLLSAGDITGLLYITCGAFVALPLGLLVRGAPLSEIRLGPERVHYRAHGRSLTAAWDDIELVGATETRYLRRIFLRARDVRRRAERFSWNTAHQRREDALGIAILTDHFGVGPAPLFHLLRFHHEHPAARAELGTAASLQRLREGRFTAP